MSQPPPVADLVLKFSSVGAVRAQADANSVAGAVRSVNQVYGQAMRTFSRTTSIMRRAGQLFGARGIGAGMVGGMIGQRLGIGSDGRPETGLGEFGQQVGVGVGAVGGTMAFMKVAGMVPAGFRRGFAGVQGAAARVGLRGVSNAMGRMAGAAAGAKAGFMLGSVVPGIGNVIGTIVGVTAGFVLGDLLGNVMGRAGDRASTALFGRAVDPDSPRYMALAGTARLRGQRAALQSAQLDLFRDARGRSGAVRRAVGDTINDALGGLPGAIDRAFIEPANMRGVDAGVEVLRQRLEEIDAARVRDTQMLLQNLREQGRL